MSPTPAVTTQPVRVPQHARRRPRPPAWWRYTAWLRRQPAFFILGTQRGGTTSLYHYLIQHPRLDPAYRKEVHYFDLNYAAGPYWYRSHFPLWRPGRLTGEATPNYLFHPLVPARMRALLPDARLIVLLRDPVARTISQYRHGRRRGHISPEESLSDLATAEKALAAAELARLHANEHYPARHYQRRCLLARSTYADQLARWFEHYPRSHFLILPSERLFAKPAQVVNHALAFLDLPPLSLPPLWLQARNRARDDITVSAKEKAWLRAHFEPHTRRLEALLDQTFPWESGHE